MNAKIDRAAVQCKISCETQRELFDIMAAPLISAGYVHDDFALHVAKREEKFPTGLPLEEVGMAIPHTDPEHVNSAALAIATLKNPIKFRVMGSPEETVGVSAAFMLALTEGHQHIELLQKVVGIAQNQVALSSIINADSDEELYVAISRLFGL